jgi:hypothetical protein
VLFFPKVRLLVLNKHTRRRFVWWLDRFRAKKDPFTSIIKAGLTVHSLKRKETKQKRKVMGKEEGQGYMPRLFFRSKMWISTLWLRFLVARRRRQINKYRE